MNDVKCVCSAFERCAAKTLTLYVTLEKTRKKETLALFQWTSLKLFPCLCDKYRASLSEEKKRLSTDKRLSVVPNTAAPLWTQF